MSGHCRKKCALTEQCTPHRKDSDCEATNTVFQCYRDSSHRAVSCVVCAVCCLCCVNSNPHREETTETRLRTLSNVFDVSLFFLRIHPFTCDDVSLRGNLYSRHEPFSLSSSASSSVVKYCPFSTVFARPCIGAQFGQCKMNWKICELFVQNRATSLTRSEGLICCRQICWHYHGL